MYKSLSKTAATLASLLLPLSVLAAQPAGVVDRILLNGEILTMEASKPIAQALAIRSNRIVAVGTNTEIRKLRSARTEVIVDQAGHHGLAGDVVREVRPLGLLVWGEGRGVRRAWGRYPLASI